MNVACDDVLLQPNEGTPSYLKNEKYYSYVRRKSIKNPEQEEKNINRVKRLISFKSINILNIIIDTHNSIMKIIINSNKKYYAFKITIIIDKNQSY